MTTNGNDAAYADTETRLAELNRRHVEFTQGKQFTNPRGLERRGWRFPVACGKPAAVPASYGTRVDMLAVVSALAQHVTHGD